MAPAAHYALVTGGNRGLGYEVCAKLAAAGRPVILTARDAGAGAKAAAQIKEAHPAAAIEVLPLDASDAASIAALASAVASKFGGAIDLLVNNAGALSGAWDEETHAAIVGTNTAGAVDITLALLPHLAAGARVVMVSSALGTLGMLTDDYAAAISGAGSIEEVKQAAAKFDVTSAMPAKAKGFPSYSVSKAALNRAVQLLAASPEFTSKGVSVVAVCPGWCATDMGNSGASDGRKPERSAGQGADSILMAADAAVAPNGSFTSDGKEVDWVKPPFPA